MELNNSLLVFLTKQLSPSILRVGGTQADYDVYTVGKARQVHNQHNAHDSLCKHVQPPMTPYRCRTVNETQWRSLLHFANVTDSLLVYGLNDLFGRPTKTKPEKSYCSKKEKEGGCPTRNVTNYEHFVRWTVENMPSGAIPFGYELGNELNNYLNGNAGAHMQSDDLRSLKLFLENFDSNVQPLTIGPDTHSSAEFSESGLAWLKEFMLHSFSTSSIEGTKNMSIDILTFHMYSMGDGPKLDPTRLNETFLNNVALDKSGAGARAYMNVVKEAMVESRRRAMLESADNSIDSSSSYPPSPASFALQQLSIPGPQVWAGETASANNGGQSGITDTFINGFWYVDQLGSHAREGVSVMCRQTLENRGGYPLLENYQPLPDYWSGLLWKQIMGTRVLNTTVSGSHIRAYAHCGSRRSGGVAIAWLNIGPEEKKLDVSAVGDTSDAMIWILQPGASIEGAVNPMQSREMRLNNVVLSIQAGSLQLPNLDGRSTEDFVVPPASYGFLLLPNVKTSACGENEIEGGTVAH